MWMWAYLNVYVAVYMCRAIDSSKYICMHVHLSICKPMFVYICVPVFICVYVHVQVLANLDEG